MLRTVVIDIEGTTSSTAFVTGRLYPYSAGRFASWIADHQTDPATSRAVAQVRELIGDRSAGPDRVVATLLDWLASDQKVTPLKTLQGLIWERGFASGDLVAHFYPDAIPALRAWKAADHGLYVFSSGSAAAQRAWFGHSPEGDLCLRNSAISPRYGGPGKTTAELASAIRAGTFPHAASPHSLLRRGDVPPDRPKSQAASLGN